MLPWLALLALMALPWNRTGTAWWIWAAVGCGFLLESALQKWGAAMVPSQPLQVFADVIKALGVSTACLWLISQPVPRTSRFKTFLYTALVQLGFGLAAYLVGGIGTGEADAVGGVIILAVCGGTIALTLTLTGVLCRRQYRPAALVIWTCLGGAAATLAILGPFLGFALLQARGQAPWSQILAVLGLVWVVGIGSLLPFVVLALTNALFRERLKSLLHLEHREQLETITPRRPLELEVH